MVRFLVRNPIRDRWKDYLRLQKLTVVLGTLSEDIAKEKAGLERRYETAMAEAAFSMNALDDPNVSMALPVNVDTMSGSLDRYSRRISELDQQMAMFDRLQRDLQRFMRDNDIDTTTLG